MNSFLWTKFSLTYLNEYSIFFVIPEFIKVNIYVFYACCGNESKTTASDSYQEKMLQAMLLRFFSMLFVLDKGLNATVN